MNAFAFDWFGKTQLREISLSNHMLTYMPLTREQLNHFEFFIVKLAQRKLHLPYYMLDGIFPSDHPYVILFIKYV